MKLLILWLAMHSNKVWEAVEHTDWGHKVGSAQDNLLPSAPTCFTDSENVRECFYFEFPVRDLRLR